MILRILYAKPNRVGIETISQPFTAPTAKPLTKYFWKNGNMTNIGPAASTHKAILALSLGKLEESTEIPTCSA